MKIGFVIACKCPIIERYMNVKNFSIHNLLYITKESRHIRDICDGKSARFKKLRQGSQASCRIFKMLDYAKRYHHIERC